MTSFFPERVPAARPVLRGQRFMCVLNFPRSYFRGFGGGLLVPFLFNCILTRSPVSREITWPQAHLNESVLKLLISPSRFASSKTALRCSIVVLAPRFVSPASLVRFAYNLWYPYYELLSTDNLIMIACTSPDLCLRNPPHHYSLLDAFYA